MALEAFEKIKQAEEEAAAIVEKAKADARDRAATHVACAQKLAEDAKAEASELIKTARAGAEETARTVSREAASDARISAAVFHLGCFGAA